MLYQLHHQFKDGHAEFVAQKDVEHFSQLQDWLLDLWERHPPPEGAHWLAAFKGSEHFIMGRA
jgi:hypothetical protein